MMSGGYRVTLGCWGEGGEYMVYVSNGLHGWGFLVTPGADGWIPLPTLERT